MLYDYECTDCHHKMIDVYQSIKDNALTKCPNCSKETLQRILYGGIGSFMKDAKTIGQLADKNWSKMGHYQKSEIENSNKKAENTLNGKASNSEINKMTPKQKERYIITGEK